MTCQITRAHIRRLVALESQVRYNQSPPAGQPPFRLLRGDGPVLLSAPHGARTFRNDRKQLFHGEDEYTAGMVLLLAETCHTPAIATVYRDDSSDPNHSPTCAYKDALRRLMVDSQTRFVIDLHGAAQNSRTLDVDQTIDLGLQGSQNGDEALSMDEQHVRRLEALFLRAGQQSQPKDFVVRRNRFPARGEGTVTSFVRSVSGDTVQALQIELKPQLRIAHRLPPEAMHRRSFVADPDILLQALQALADFIAYLQALP